MSVNGTHRHKTKQMTTQSTLTAGVTQLYHTHIGVKFILISIPFVLLVFVELSSKTMGRHLNVVFYAYVLCSCCLIIFHLPTTFSNENSKMNNYQTSPIPNQLIRFVRLEIVGCHLFHVGVRSSGAARRRGCKKDVIFTSTVKHLAEVNHKPYETACLSFFAFKNFAN